MNEEKIKEKLEELKGQDVFILINGVITLTLMYKGFDYFMNKNCFLICNIEGSEINIETSSIEKIEADGIKVIIKLDNEQQIFIQL